MTTSLQNDFLAGSRDASKDSTHRLTACLHEPLFHFIVLGFMLFTVDHFLFTRVDDPHTIVIGAQVDREAQQVFKASRGREANAEELAALRKVWLDNEVLYREGLALQVDKGDTGIRERVIFKALSIVDANLKRPPLDEKVLRDWFESHRSKYDEPVRYDFKEAVLSGDTSEAATRAFASELNAGAPGDTQAGLRVFTGRPEANLLQSYGAEFVKALEQAPPGEWRAQSTNDGWRVIQLTALSPGKPADFESLHGIVLQDWTDSVMAEQRSAAVHALAKKYTVQIEGAAK